MVIICVIVALILWIAYLIWENQDNDLDAGIFIGSFIGINLVGLGLGFLLTLLFGIIAVDCPQIPCGEPQKVELVAMKDNSTINGNFFLGSGSINEDQYYFYLEQTNKGIQKKKVKADHNTYLNYIENDDTPYLLIQKTRCENDIIYALSHKCYDVEYYFYIPDGSITNEFSVDLE